MPTQRKRIVPVVLAGGSGTRLWPISRKQMPKQFLRLFGNKSLFQLAVERAVAVEGSARPVIVTSEGLAALVHADLRDLQVEADILLEPIGRNTAAAVCFAAHRCQDEDVMLVLSADQWIPDTEAFALHVRESVDTLEGELATISVRPTYAATQFGYVELTKLRTSGIGYQVGRFVEKPCREDAEKYIESWRFLWNSGIFLFPKTSLMQRCEEHIQSIWADTQKALEAGRQTVQGLILDEATMESMDSVSIDIGVMEKVPSVTFPYEGDWSDLGSWAALHSRLRSGKEGNSLMGDVYTAGVKNSVAIGSDKLIVATNLENIAIVDTSDALFVTSLDPAASEVSADDRLRQVQIDLAGRSEIETSDREVRPWGRFDDLYSGQECRIKKIVVEPGRRLSLQSHTQRSETWLVLQGDAGVQIDDSFREVSQGEVIQIPLGAKHRLQNVGEQDLVIIEIQTGAYFGEDDIVRYEDDFGRRSPKPKN